MSKSAATIAYYNDLFRTGSIVGNNPAAASLGKIVTTRGIHALPPGDYFAILGKVAGHSDFPASNDPYGEHDFGAFDHNGKRVFWKIDYYERASFPERELASEDPSDPAKTYRVLTIMSADEY